VPPDLIPIYLVQLASLTQVLQRRTKVYCTVWGAMRALWQGWAAGTC